ncbi:MAG: MFS transporter [Chloroflexi bacterium]|nr:MFS transporter [Chloroflexota bacterium]
MYLVPQLAHIVVHPRQHPTELSYVNGFFYGLGLGMLMVLVPLYVIDLGFELAALGLVVSSAGVFLVLLRLAGGAVSDRFGERVVLGFSFVALVVCAAIFIVSSTLLPLIIGQLINGASRSVYWSAGQSYTSRSAEGHAGLTMGRLLSAESGGTILGSVLAGSLAQLAGFDVAFMAAAAANVAGIVATVAMPPLPRAGQVRSIRSTLAPAGRMMVQRSLRLGHFTALMAAAYAALLGSLYLAFFKEAGYGDAVVGLLRSVGGIGVVVVAYPFGAIVARLGAQRVAVAGFAITGAVTALTALVGSSPAAAVLLVAVGGMAFGGIRALYPAIAVANSPERERALSLAVVGLFWAAGMLAVPYLFGLLGDGIGIQGAMYAFGAIGIVAAVATPVVSSVWRTRPETAPRPGPPPG